MPTCGLLRHDMGPSFDVQGSSRDFTGVVTTARDGDKIASNCDVNFVGTVNRDTGQTEFFNGLRYDLISHGPDNIGGRHALFGAFQMDCATSPSNLNRNYAGIAGFGTAFSGDNGTGLTVETAKGALFGVSAVADLRSDATNWLNLSAIEANTFSCAGSSYAYASGVALVSRLDHSAAIVDAACWIGSQGGAGWRYGVLFTDRNGAYPVAPYTTLFGSDWVTATEKRPVANGVDLRGFSFSDAAFAAPNFKIDANGNIQVTGTAALVELGSKTTAGAALVDFNTSGNGNDFDVRLIAGGGTTTGGRGGLTAILDSFYVGGQLAFRPAASATPANNGDLAFELTSNTSLKIKVKGSDGVVRTATLALS